MKDEKKTKDQLITELKELRRRVTQLEAAETQRKQAERALADSEVLYQSLVESLPQNIFRKDREGPCFNITKGWTVPDILKVYPVTTSSGKQESWL